MSPPLALCLLRVVFMPHAVEAVEESEMSSVCSSVRFGVSRAGFASQQWCMGTPGAVRLWIYYVVSGALQEQLPKVSLKEKGRVLAGGAGSGWTGHGSMEAQSGLPVVPGH